MIGNDGAKSQTIKCYWMDKDQVPYDFELTLTAYQPIWFSALTGWGTYDVPPFGDNATGELKCWAIDIPTDAENQLEKLYKYDYLYGNALIMDVLTPRAFEYNAWAFAMPLTQPIEHTNLDLDGKEYDACPAYLVYNFFANGGSAAGVASFGASTLSLSPCQQDLRQDRIPICAKAKFDIWNENEAKLTGSYQCVKCYFEGVLTEIGTKIWQKMNGTDACNLGAKCKKTGVGGTRFGYPVLHTDLGRFRVSPDTWPACKGVFATMSFGPDGKEAVVDRCEPAARQFKTPFVGVLLTEVAIFTEYDAWAGTTGTGAGAFTTTTQPPAGFPPYISWDRGVNYSVPQR
jgi:hypothetical protein